MPPELTGHAEQEEEPGGQPESGAGEGLMLPALLDLSGPGGFVVLLGGAAAAAAGLAAQVGGIHCVGVNAPANLMALPALSLVRCETAVPLRGAMARGVVVGAELASPAWLTEAVRVLLPGRRLVVAGEEVAPPGVRHLVTGQGLWVGEKR